MKDTYIALVFGLVLGLAIGYYAGFIQASNERRMKLDIYVPALDKK